MTRRVGTLREDYATPDDRIQEEASTRHTSVLLVFVILWYRTWLKIWLATQSATAMNLISTAKLWKPSEVASDTDQLRRFRCIDWLSESCRCMNGVTNSLRGTQPVTTIMNSWRRLLYPLALIFSNSSGAESYGWQPHSRSAVSGSEIQ